TISPMGGRMLKRWLALPLKNPEKIRRRHEVVSHLSTKDALLSRLQQYFKQIGDLERLISKVATGKINLREAIQLKNSLEAIVPINQSTEQNGSDAQRRIGDQLHSCDLLRNMLKETLHEDAPVNLLKGKTI